MSSGAETASAVCLLVLEDDASGVAALNRRLAEAPWCATGFETTVDTTLAAALKMLEERRFDAVIASACLLDSGGVATLRSVAPDTAIVVVTDQGVDESTARAALGAGAQDVLPRSEIGHLNLARILWNAIARHRTYRRVENEAIRRERALADAMPHLVWTCDNNGQTLTVNAPTTAHFGRAAGEITFDFCIDQIHPEDRERAVATWTAALAAGTPFELEERILDAGGAYRWVLVRSVPVRDEATGISRWCGTATDIEPLKRLEAELRASEARYRSLLELSPQILFLACPDGSMSFANQRWLDYTGLSREENLGSGWLATVEPGERARIASAWAEAAAAGRPIETELAIRRHDGVYRWHVVRVVPTRAADGALEHLVGVAVDIDERRQAELALVAAKEAAETANREKGIFFASVSHEIRSPLAAILGFVDLLREGGIGDDERTNYLDVIARNGQALRQLVDDLLDLSKVEAGRLETEKADVRLTRLLEDVESTFELQAKDKGIELQFESVGVVPDVVRSDPARLRQILFNVVGNAVKFTAVGGVHVTVCMTGKESTASAERRLAFIVRDTGRGIAAADAGRLFRPFSQVGRGTTKTHGGTGLGLALSKRLAQALGGDVELSGSVVDEGSVFTVTINPGLAPPKAVAATPTDARRRTEGVPTAGRIANPGTALSGVRVLIADDTRDNLVFLDFLLRREGATVSMVENGAEAVEAAMAAPFDIVIMDVQMPVLDGYAATAELRKNGFSRPILALTAHALKEEREQAFRVGCDEHLSKPVSPKVLVGALARLLEGRERAR